MAKNPVEWHLKDLERVAKNGFSVFSCFSCGGGSSMGYKRAGFDVIGNVEIDAAMNALYVKNLHPKHNYCMDIRDFKRIPDADLPAALFSLDILDGSPPCSTFSMAGDREKTWGKEKVFREGQAAQTLDDLFFEFLDVAERLRPKVIVAENVKGILHGNAKGYVNLIVRRLREMGYDVQIFLLNAANMGVSQRRERVFFIARLASFAWPNLRLDFHEKPIPFGAVRDEHGIPLAKDSKYRALLSMRRVGDQSIGDITERVRGKKSGFNNMIAHDGKVTPTIAANGHLLRFVDGMRFTDRDIISCQSFPFDYDFCGATVQYVCGMSVPPFMMERIARQIATQWLTPKTSKLAID